MCALVYLTVDSTLELGCCSQMMVFDRKEPIERFIQTSKAKLHMKKKAKGAAVLEGEEVRYLPIVAYVLDVTGDSMHGVTFMEKKTCIRREIILAKSQTRIHLQ